MVTKRTAGWWGSDPLEGDAPQDLMSLLEDARSPREALEELAKDLQSDYENDVYGALGAWDWVMTHGSPNYKRAFAKAGKIIATAAHVLLLSEDFMDSWVELRDRENVENWLHKYTEGKPTGKLKKSTYRSEGGKFANTKKKTQEVERTAGWYGTDPLGGDDPHDTFYRMDEAEGPVQSAKEIARTLREGDAEAYGALGVWDWVMTHGPPAYKRAFAKLSKAISLTAQSLLSDDEFLESWVDERGRKIVEQWLLKYTKGKPTGEFKREEFIDEDYEGRFANTKRKKKTMAAKRIEKKAAPAPKQEAVVAKKKKAQEVEHQPGNVSDKLKRRMGDAHADVFNTVGIDLYNSIVLTVKGDLENLFNEHIGTLQNTIKEELGNRGLKQAAEYFAPWILEVMEDVIHFGMKDVAGKLEELANSAASEFVQESEEAEEPGEEDLFGVEEEPTLTEEVEEVGEEEVEEPPEEEEVPAEEEAPAEEVTPPGLEELMAPEEEGEAPAAYDGAPKQRIWRRKNPLNKRVASTEKPYNLKVAELVDAAGGEKAINDRFTHANEIFEHLTSVQERLVQKMGERFHAVKEVDPVKTLDWVMKRWPYRK